MIISHPDRALTRRIIAAGSDHRQVDSWIGRRFPRLLAAVGVQDVRVRAFTTVDQEPSGFFANQARHRAATAAEVSAITDAERQRWLEAFEAEIATGGVVGWGTYLFVWGTRPTTLPTPAP
jgi:hypothetical protein